MEIKEQNEGAPEVTPWIHGEEPSRFNSVYNLLTSKSTKFTPTTFSPSSENFEILQEDFRVLVVGAGGLGCEILKNLALSGFKDLEVIDLDTIELSNLNRQFLFRKKDIGYSKAQVAAEFVMKRVPGVSVKWYKRKLQDFEPSFYSKFNVIIAGLDNVEARRWLNAMLYDLIKYDEEGQTIPDSIIPFIDGGTEGFLGQARLFIPRIGACFECSVGTMAPPKSFQSCTIASIPRTPDHCIAYAHKVLWPKLRSLNTASDYDMVPVEDKNTKDPEGVILDTDNIEHTSWLFNKALERAKNFKIEGVTYNLTLQVVKNIIPAIASTNALISAACCNEALKVLTWSSYGLDNYFMYMGQDGIYTRTFQYQKNPACLVCGNEPLLYKLDPGTQFGNLYKKICQDPTLKLKNPAITVGNKSLFMSVKFLRQQYEENFNKQIQELFSNNSVLQITDTEILGRRIAKIIVRFEEGTFFIPEEE